MSKPPIEYVRQKPTEYIPSGVIDLCDFSGSFVSDALSLHVSPVVTEIFEGWHIVAAKEDWITKESRYSVFDSFYRLQLRRKAGNNFSNRANIIVAAFAQHVVTFGIEGKTIVKDCNLDLSSLERHIEEKYSGYRVVSFLGLDETIKSEINLKD